MATSPIYTCNPQHRNHAFQSAKSQWSISILEEQSVFQCMYSSNWMNSTHEFGWGLHLNNGRPQILGRTKLPDCSEVQIAKFRVDQGQWHGYPSAHWLAPYDKPPQEIAKLWLNAAYISKSAFSKICRGKRCSL